MAGLFETAETLRQQQVAKLGTRQVHQAPVEQKSLWGAAGGALGRYVKGKWDAGRAEDAAVAERERQAGVVGDADLTTSSGTAIAAKRAIEAGDQTLADSLIKRSKSLGELEKQQKTAAADKVSKPITSDDDRTMAVDLIRSRADADDTLVGGTLAPMYSEDATEAQKGQAAFFRSALAEQASTVHQQLIDKGISGITKTMVTEAMLDEIEGTPGIINEETGIFGFFGEDAGVDTRLLNKTLHGMGSRIVSGLTEQFKKGNKPVQTAEHQQTTKAPAVDSRTGLPTQDVQGKVAGAGEQMPQGQKLANDPKKQSQVDALEKQRVNQMQTLETMKAANADAGTLKQMEGIIKALEDAQDKLVK